MRNANVRGWPQLHNRLDNQYRNDNPDLPTLEPWVLKTRPPADRFVFERNPYFHRVDADGRQLPYIDRVAASVADGRLIPPKTGAGEADLQARNISLRRLHLPASRRRSGTTTRCVSGTPPRARTWRSIPNLNVNDPVWRELFRDVRFRRALSLAINRDDINQVIYFGLALEGQNTVLPDSPLYRAKYRDAWAQFDMAEANRLLDELGLKKRDGRGVRLLPDGRPLEIIVETAGEDTRADRRARADPRSLAQGRRQALHAGRRSARCSATASSPARRMMSIWIGLENGIPTADMSPEELAPTSQQQLQWPKWGQFSRRAAAAARRSTTRS